MLFRTLCVGETLTIGDITIRVRTVGVNDVNLGIDAPADVPIRHVGNVNPISGRRRWSAGGHAVRREQERTR